MKLINSKVEILDKLDGEAILKKLERIARTCYKSEDRITDDATSAKKIISNIIKSGHEAMIEHVSISVKFTCDRITSQSIVRHRIASYAQESTRYCNYAKDKFGGEITFVKPSNWDELDEIDKEIFIDLLNNCETSYINLIKRGWKAQMARAVLPNCLKTEINMTANLREWRTFFKLRCDTPAHPDIRIMALQLLTEFHDKIPVIFDDLYDKFIKQ